MDLTREPLPTQRALGVVWDVQQDQLAVKVNVLERPATKRGLLSIVSSVYDPMGFISPITIRAKLLFQDECRRKKGWDEPLTNQNDEAWKKWLEELKHVSNFRVPRCYKEDGLKELTHLCLHHFCDASEKAYGVVSYLRMVDNKNRVHCAFVYGKARVAPLKQQTIPRLELCAAVLAAKVDKGLRKELDIGKIKSVFWSDSNLVLQYISNTEARFRTFVAKRIALIREISSAQQWRHVGTALNPADNASRGIPARDMNKDCRWIKGPEFLWQSKQYWLGQKGIPRLMDNDVELKMAASLLTVSAGAESING